MPSWAGPKHALVGWAEECARHGAGIAAGLHEGVAAHLDGVAQVAVVPHRAGPHVARRRIGRPLFEPREIRRARQRCQVDRESGGPGDDLGARRKAKQAARPCDAAGEFGVVRGGSRGALARMPRAAPGRFSARRRTRSRRPPRRSRRAREGRCRPNRPARSRSRPVGCPAPGGRRPRAVLRDRAGAGCVPSVPRCRHPP